MSNCDKYIELMHLELDGELSELEVKMLEKHIGVCPSCREEYQDLKQVAQLFEGVELVEPPLALKHIIMAQVRRAEIDELEQVAEPVKVAVPTVGQESIEPLPELPERKPLHKLGIGMLVVVAIINTFFFCYWVLPLIGFNQNSGGSSMVTAVTVQSFSKFSMVGQHTGSAIQVVLNSLLHMMPWNWIAIYLCITGLLLVIMWTVARKKGGNFA